MRRSIIRSDQSFLSRISWGKRGNRRAARRGRKLAVEALEGRMLLSTVTWTNLSGGNWDVGSNWSGGSVPAAGDDVVINTLRARLHRRGNRRTGPDCEGHTSLTDRSCARPTRLFGSMCHLRLNFLDFRCMPSILVVCDRGPRRGITTCLVVYSFVRAPRHVETSRDFDDRGSLQ